MTEARLVHESNNLTPHKQKRIDYHHVGLSQEALLETFNRLDGIVRKVAIEKEADIIDASVNLSGKVWAFDDHVHVVPKGSAALAQFVTEHLQIILKKIINKIYYKLRVCASVPRPFSRCLKLKSVCIV